MQNMSWEHAPEMKNQFVIKHYLVFNGPFSSYEINVLLL